MPSGTTVLAAADNQISVLDLVAARPLHMIRNHQKTVSSLCLASHNTRLVSGGLDGHMKVFETTGWNAVAGSKYPSPILSLNVIAAGGNQEDRHLAVGLQSGTLSIRTRLSGQQKVKERERKKEMEALIEGRIEEHDKKMAKKRPRGWDKRFRGRDFTGEGVDIVIEGNPGRKRKKRREWEKLLHKGQYAAALDAVLEKSDLQTILTLLTALRHRSAMRTALSNRDDVSLQPIFKWVCKFMTNPRHVRTCVDQLMVRLHRVVRGEVDNAQMACQTKGMLGMFVEAP